MNKIPPVGDCFTAICSWVYNDKNGKLKVNDYNTRKRPGKNQINFAYAASTSETIPNPNPHKFYAKEYVVYELEQICPIISVKFKREEFCVIWRDNNFSKEKIFGGDWDDKFKSYLRARIKYIEQLAKYNVYTFENIKEALECVNRKKYNKIILISNVGTDFGGQHFVEEARKIIKNDSIVLFSSFSKEHLKWIVTWRNALFSEDETLTEEQIARKLHCRPSDILSFSIERQSLDARHDDLHFSYTVLENHKPVTVGTWEDMMFSTRGGVVEYKESDYFADEDGEQLVYTIVNSDESVANVNYSKGTFYVTALGLGYAEVTVTATDVRGEQASQHFRILVRESSEPVDVYPNPVKDILYVRTSEEASAQLKLVSVTGATVYENQLTISPFDPAQVNV